jgi:hypothetical protein
MNPSAVAKVFHSEILVLNARLSMKIQPEDFVEITVRSSDSYEFFGTFSGEFVGMQSTVLHYYFHTLSDMQKFRSRTSEIEDGGIVEFNDRIFTFRKIPCPEAKKYDIYRGTRLYACSEWSDMMIIKLFRRDSYSRRWAYDRHVMIPSKEYISSES